MDPAIFEKRRKVYEEARVRHPERWSGEIRDWSLENEVWLNPERMNMQRSEEKKTS